MINAPKSVFMLVAILKCSLEFVCVHLFFYVTISIPQGAICWSVLWNCCISLYISLVFFLSLTRYSQTVRAKEYH